MDNFTPVFDSIIKDHGATAALVFGRMWRYSQMQENVCKASIDTIADDLGMNRMTVIRAQERLIIAGLIVDTTPDRRNKPHVYTLSTITKSDTNDKVTVSKSDSHSNKKLPSESQIVTATITKSDLNQTLKDTIKDTPKETASAPDDPYEWPMRDIAERMTGLTMTSADIPTLRAWEKAGVIDSDIVEALAWRESEKKPPVKSISQLAGGVQTSRLQRIQAASSNGHKRVYADPRNIPVEEY